jgi:hypothetical protein
MGRFETGGDDLDSRPVTEATHPTYHNKWGLLRGAVLLSLAPITWQAGSRGQPARLKVVTENAEALTEHRGS